jgi:hypothetical protein
VLGLTCALGLTAAFACKQPQIERPTDVGQWIWTSTDSARFVEAAQTVPTVTPTVWIGTIRASKAGKLESALGLSPQIAGRPNVGVLVRFDDSFSIVWNTQNDATVSMAVDSALQSILTAANNSGVKLTEVQLDYDCPERLLGRWSAVVTELSRGILAGQSVWLTSLVSHVRHREYGDLFRGHVAGHILQVFDTGDRMSLPYARQLERLASRQRMPFRLGVAAFERRFPNGRVTNHKAWFGAMRFMLASEWYRGVWVFPAGASWVDLLEAKK